MILEYAQKVLEGGELTQDEAIELINVSDADTMLLLAMADKIRQKFNTNEVDCCAIINARSGHCSEDCKFCAQSAYNKTGVEVYGLLPEEEIVAAAQKAKAAGAVRFSIVTSGRGQQEQEDFRKICKTLTRIKEEVKIEVCASLGILTKEQALALKEAGVTRFHSNIETAPSHFLLFAVPILIKIKCQPWRLQERQALEFAPGAYWGLMKRRNKEWKWLWS